MDFSFSEEQELIKKAAKAFAEAEISPIAAQSDKDSDFPFSVIEAAHTNGFLNLAIPAEYGGIGLSAMDQLLVIEELAKACSGITTSIIANDLALLPIEIGGSEEQKKRILGGVTAKPQLASFCLSEPGAGSDVAGLSTTLTKVPGGYKLNGAKQWITNGGVAAHYTVFATLDKSKKHKGICCVAVPAGTKGISTGHHEDKLGQRASNTASVIFEDVFVPDADLIGKEGDGFQIAMKTLDNTRPITAIMAVGVAQAAINHAVRYAKERKQFGQALAEFQGLQFMLADMQTLTDASRLLCYQAAYALDTKQNNPLASAMAKRLAADTAMQVTTDAVQIYGGYGYTKEYPVEKLMRDAKLFQIYEGTSQIQRVVIAREMLK